MYFCISAFARVSNKIEYSSYKVERVVAYTGCFIIGCGAGAYVRFAPRE